MELKRRVRDRISFVLLILGNIATTLSGKNLHCTNDCCETFICHFEAQNCTEYNLTLRCNNCERKGTFTQCDVGQCCCSVEEMSLILGEMYNATVWKGAKSMESKIISVQESIKPKPPTIVSVKESNGNFLVKWDPNMKVWFRNRLRANVTYYKKGDTEKVTASFKPTIIDGLNSYEILGRNLEPSTTYAVSVKSSTSFSGMYSDSSKEWEFTSTASPDAVRLAIIISLSIAAVIITGVIFVCFVKIKTKWWDTAAKWTNPKLFVIHPSEQKVLKPGTTNFSIVYIEPIVPDDSKLWSKGSPGHTSSGSLQQSSGISLSSSCFSYANAEPADIKACVEDALDKVFAGTLSHLTTKKLNKDSGLLSFPCSPLPANLADDSGMSCESSDFVNKTYSILIPSCPHEIVTDSSEVQTQAEMLCESAYHPIAGAIVTCVDPQAPACPLVNSPPGVLTLMTTDMSYQPCNADSVGFSSAENSSLSCVFSGTNTMASSDPVSRVEARFQSSEEAVCGATKQHGKPEGATVMDEKPASLYIFPPMDDDYQPFQNLVGQSDIWFSEKRTDEKEEHFNMYPEELFTKMDQSIPCFNNNVQESQCLSELQRPFLHLIPADQSMPPISDIGYKSV
ncbi:uncharacterized protein LOC117728748 isoform X2 [Cyclopterus lumpus]|uniref:uncharacterized protein LOC117728748 isoform X2 n=1 Tax=Cyclopterus lumpus TaxID=8103 RepID=UPI0014862435|nr:uncharacterized protein LOC117728748 isoform X2 [Cyclopterus lumpus]